MPDISICQNESCPSKLICYRFTAYENPFRQTYGLFEHDGLKCDAFWFNDRCPLCRMQQGHHKLTCYNRYHRNDEICKQCSKPLNRNGECVICLFK